MPSEIFRPVFQYEPEAWLDQLPAYNLNQGVDALLNLSRKLYRANAYYWKSYPFPTGTDWSIAGRGTFEGTLTLEPFSYLVCVTADFYTDITGGTPTRGAGFKLQVYDKGAKTYIFERTYARDRTVAPSNTPGVAGAPFGPHFLRSPLIILEPGQLDIEITNMDSATQIIQLLFSFAIPLTNASASTPEMKGLDT